MNFNPNTLFIGVIDFFAVILPGVLLSVGLYYYNVDTFVFILSKLKYPDFFPPLLFLLAAYLLGHAISQVSSYLDSLIFDNLKPASPDALDSAKQIRTKKYDNGIADLETVNTFEWSCLKLRHDFTAAYIEVERLIAESKFFRSLFLVAVVAFLFYFFHNQQLAIGSLAFAVFSMVRYVSKRRKAIGTAYNAVIYLDRLSDAESRLDHSTRGEPPKPKPISEEAENTDVSSLTMRSFFERSETPPSVTSLKERGKSKFIIKDRQQALFCLTGSGLLLLSKVTDAHPINMSPDTMVELAAGSEYELTNTGNTSLVVALGVIKH